MNTDIKTSKITDLSQRKAVIILRFLYFTIINISDQ